MLKQLDTLIGFAVVMLVVSLLITIATQMVSSFLALRGRNLADALQVMIKKIDPTIEATRAIQLAMDVLIHPTISDSCLSMDSLSDKIPGLAYLRKRWKLASAIRPDELHAILKDISQGAASPTSATARALLDALAIPNPTTSAAIWAVTGQLTTIAGKDFDQAKALVHQLADATDIAAINLEKWFNSAQDRAQQWFAMHARIITVVGAFVAAFVLQLDTIDLLKRISTGSDMRSKLVAGSDTILKKAGQVLADTQEVVDKGMHKEAITKLKTTYPSIPDDKFDKHEDFASVSAASQWFSEQIDKHGDGELKKQRDAIAAAYERSITAAKMDAYMQTVQHLVGATGLQLLPEPYPLSVTRSGAGWFGWVPMVKTNGTWSWPKHKLLGILLSVALLSLGAPFWYNTLKSLASLRPLVADEVEKNPKQTISARPT